MMGPVIGALRGGSVLETATGTITNSLLSGPFGVLGLAAIACSIVTPLTIYKQAYSFSVSYGLSVMVMALALLKTFGLGGSGPVGSLLVALVVYGLRLSAHLYVRELTVPSKKEQIKSFDKTPRLKRIPFSMSVGLFYGFMVTPALYLCRAGAGASGLSDTATAFAKAGGALAWFGAIVEAWTDGQKFLKKRGKDGSMDFLGPSTWWYSVSRHPNYVGEILFWTGVFVSGLPSFFADGLTVVNVIASVCSFFGFYGILQIMLGASTRLDGKQDEKYGGQMHFEEWKSNTSKLAPTSVKGLTRSILPGSVSVGLTILAIKLAAKL